VVELQPDYWAARNNLALTYEAADDAKRAERTYRTLTRDAPQYAAGWFNLGGLLSAEERHEEAIAAYQGALEAQPNYRKAQLNLGVAYSRAERYDEAIAAYRGLLFEHPRYVAGWYNLALAYKQAGQPDRAREARVRALSLDPSSRPAAESLARLELQRGDWQAASAVYQELVDLHPGDAGLRLELAKILQRAGDVLGCRRELVGVLAAVADPASARERWAQCALGDETNNVEES